MNKATENRTKRIIFSDQINKKAGWIIPIAYDDKFITGQNLPLSKMIGKEDLTSEEIKQYPYVINPENFYRVKHRQPFNLSLDYDKAIYDLLMLTGKIADGEHEYKRNKVKYIGYFFDQEQDAVEKNKERDDIYDAQTLIRKLPIEKYRNVALLLNYMVKGSFYIPIENVSPDLQKNKLLEVCEKHPKEVMKCFPENNKGIDLFMWILELVDTKIIRQTTRGEFWYEQEFLGESIEAVIRTLSKKEYDHLKKIFDNRLSVKKGHKVEDLEPVKGVKEKTNEFIFKLREAKSYIFDENIVEFKKVYEDLLNNYSEFLSGKEYKKDMERIEAYMTKINTSKVREEYRTKLSERNLESLQKGISSGTSPFNKEDVKDVWDNEEKLREYMINTKFPL